MREEKQVVERISRCYCNIVQAWKNEVLAQGNEDGEGNRIQMPF
jgi:hypothetical protein